MSGRPGPADVLSQGGPSRWSVTLWLTRVPDGGPRENRPISRPEFTVLQIISRFSAGFPTSGRGLDIWGSHSRSGFTCKFCRRAIFGPAPENGPRSARGARPCVQSYAGGFPAPLSQECGRYADNRLSSRALDHTAPLAGLAERRATAGEASSALLSAPVLSLSP